VTLETKTGDAVGIAVEIGNEAIAPSLRQDRCFVRHSVGMNPEFFVERAELTQSALDQVRLCPFGIIQRKDVGFERSCRFSRKHLLRE